MTTSRPRVVIRLPGPPREDRAFDALGTTVRVVVEAHDAADRAHAVERLVRDYDERLSRFRPTSELCALNAARTRVVPASVLLRDAVRAGLWAAARSGGLVDPTLLPALERAGYTRSRRSDDGRAAAGVPLPGGPARPARPDPAARWRTIRVDDDAGVIVRPPGLRLDLGGSGKGHVADLAAAVLDGADLWAIDCGGDVRVGGTAGTPQPVHVAHPLDGTVAAALPLAAGAVATSAITARAWRAPDGTPRHHLLDPATGEPVWTGLVAATALAPTVLEAETLAKTALLAGPAAADRVLGRHGGLVVDAAGATTPIRLPKTRGQTP